MQHFLEGYPLLRLSALAVMAIVLSAIVQRGFRHGYVPMQAYH
jgi:hypothetical protein